MALIPSEIEITDDFRYITINGTSSLSKGLIMSGNTPLSIKTPRRQTINIDGFHGSIDISWQKGNLYFDNRMLQYKFAMFIPRDPDETLDEINERCENEIQELYSWVSSLDGVNSILVDSGAGTFFAVGFENLNVSKTFKNDMWVLSIDMAFRANPAFMPAYFSYPTASSVKTEIDNTGRSFTFNNIDSWTAYKLYISSQTPLEEPPVKHDYITLPFMDGNYNSGCYYEDDVISYTGIFILDNNGSRNDMNKKCQAAVEQIMSWLYGPTGSESHNNIQMKGTATLVDSTLGTFYFARCTGFSVTKSMTDLYWILSYSITFTAYPQIVSNTW